MKKHHTLQCAHDYNFVVLGINSHSRGYKLCWHINKKLSLNFELTTNHNIGEDLSFVRYKSELKEGGAINLILNQSKNGYMIPSKKSVNYFLIIEKEIWTPIKETFLNKLKTINDILLVFELDIEKEKNKDRFIVYDKKN